MDYTKNWKIDKKSKISYTEQLVRNIRWSIFTGEVRWREKLPPIRILAEQLGVGVNTVRAAYKQLEQQELVITRPHSGTIVLMEAMDKEKFEEELITSIKNALYYCLSPDEVREIVEKVLKDATQKQKKETIFVYGDQEIGDRYVAQIALEADVNVIGVHVDELADYLNKNRSRIEGLDAIITTYFLYAKVRSIARNYQPIIYGMTVEISKEILDEAEKLPEEAEIAVICKKEESAAGFVNLLERNNPGLRVKVYYEESMPEWSIILDEASMLCVSPSLYEKTKKMGGEQIPIYEIWDKINEQSMNMLRDYLH